MEAVFDSERELGRLRATVAGFDDLGQRSFMRELTMQNHVDHKKLAEQVNSLEEKVDVIHKALFVGDPETKAPGLVPFTNRVSIFLDTFCRLWRWFFAFVMGLVGLLPVILWWLGR